MANFALTAAGLREGTARRPVGLRDRF